MALEAGASVGPYVIHSPLGAGGMGEVYRARDSRLGRDVALKVLPESFAADAERIARFEREAQFLAALSHAHIAAIYGLELSGQVRVLVMELVEGESLEARLRRGALPLDEALAIANQVGEALGAAHERGIVHRDLKPGNIMLTPDGSVKVLDFGLARMVETDAAASGLSMSPTLSIQATLAGTILGTAPYMSPEQARGRPVDKRTDVWAFGCVLFEMLTGTRAFDGDDITETIASIVKGDPDWTALPPSVPAHIVSVVRGCLAKDPRQRFADIAVPVFLLAQPDAAATTTPGSAAAASPAPGWQRALPVAAAVILTAMLAGAADWVMRPAPAAAPVTRFTFPLPAGQAFVNIFRGLITIAPDGSAIVYSANQRLYVRSMADTEPRAIPGSDTLGGSVAPTFSPDGREIVFVSGTDNTLRRIAVTGGTDVTICSVTNLSGLRWEPDGIVFSQNGKGVFRVAPTGGQPQLLIATAADEVVTAAQALPGDGGRLYSLRKTVDSWDRGNVMVQTPSGEKKVIVRGGSDGRYDGYGHLLYAVSGVVMAVPFDVDHLAVTGSPVPAIEGILHPLTGNAGGGAQYAVASNGTLAYIPGPVKSGDDSLASLAIFDGKGGVEPLDIAPANYRYPRVSPDGRTVALEQGSDPEFNVWVKDLTTKAASRRLTFAGHNRAPIWSPDSQWIAFQSDRDGDMAIYRQRADGTGVAERLTAPEASARYTPQSWSPDGAYILLSVEKDKAFELQLLSLKDRGLTKFSDVTSAIPVESSFSPDGRWIVYQRNDKPEPLGTQSFIEPFPATGAKFLVPVPFVAGHPYWSRKGDRLYFNTSATSNAVVDVRTSPTVSFSPPQPFSRVRRSEPNPATSRRNVDALPDGRVLGISFNLGRGDDAAVDQITVVLNWQQMLNARMAH